MADDINVKDASDTSRTVATDEIAGRNYQIVKLAIGADGSVTLIDAALPVSGPLTDAQLRASAVPVSGTITANAGSGTLAVSGPLTDAQLRAAVVPVSGTITANAGTGTLAVSGPLTDTQLRATAVPVSGALTNAQLRAAAVPTVENALILTGQAAQTATVNNILEAAAGANATDVANQRSASVQVVSTGTGGTFIFEQSNDNASWAALPVFNAALVTAVPITAAITATNSQIIYSLPLRCQYLRLRIASTITGGSIQAFTRLSSDPWTTPAQLVASNTGANLAVSGTVTANVTGYPTAAASADALANPTVTKVDATALAFNGTTWDRTRNNVAVSVEASSAKVASGNSAAALTNFNGKGVHLFINVSAASGTTPTLAVRVQVQDPVSSTWVDLPGAVTASITGISIALLTIYPGIVEAANSRVSNILPRTWRLAWTIGGTTPSFTFSVGAQYI